MSTFLVIKMFVLKIKMVLQKYKIVVKLDLVFIILWPSLQIIYVDGYILLTKNCQITMAPISYSSIGPFIFRTQS